MGASSRSGGLQTAELWEIWRQGCRSLCDVARTYPAKICPRSHELVGRDRARPSSFSSADWRPPLLDASRSAARAVCEQSGRLIELSAETQAINQRDRTKNSEAAIDKLPINRDPAQWPANQR